MTSEAETPES